MPFDDKGQYHDIPALTEAEMAEMRLGDSAPWIPPLPGNMDTLGNARAALENYAQQHGTAEDKEVAARHHIAAALRLIFPESAWDDDVNETARRVLGYWQEFVPESKPNFNFTTFKAAPGQLILVGDIEFASLCAHHLLPFTGKIHVGYIARKVQVGLSKVPRLVQFWARRPQVQEKLTAEILHDLKERLETKDVIVVCEARHTCVSARGTRLHNGVMRTSLPSGLFLSSPPAREEFFSLLARNGV